MEDKGNKLFGIILIILMLLLIALDIYSSNLDYNIKEHKDSKVISIHNLEDIKKNDNIVVLL